MHGLLLYFRWSIFYIKNTGLNRCFDLNFIRNLCPEALYPELYEIMNDDILQETPRASIRQHL